MALKVFLMPNLYFIVHFDYCYINQLFIYEEIVIFINK